MKETGSERWEQLREDYRDTNRSLRAYMTTQDPLHDVLGSVAKSNPEAMSRIEEEAQQFGVEIVRNRTAIAYAPGLRKGQPGQLHLNPQDSVGAWLHEEQHMLDDKAAGWLGFAGITDVDYHARTEYNAYGVEIELAKSLQRDDVVQALTRLRDAEIERIKEVFGH